jgi:2-polyprenyl-6-hydroxyphenyl methylase/3-demethylubiquinone-9 3-methyltransferase
MTQPTSAPDAVHSALTGLDSHFAFGANWRAFSALVTSERIAHAEEGLRKLLAPADLSGRRMLDVGCGAGLSMIAALRLGARRVDGMDLDPQAVDTARTLLSQHAAPDQWSVCQRSILDLASEPPGQYDVVHSWGVLHHTGDMWRALGIACAQVAPRGVLCVALYRRTPLCPLWTAEKRFYAAAPRWAQRLCRAAFKSAFVAGLAATGRRPSRYIANYKTARGMDWHHDVHDWLGGYPYESVTPVDVVEALTRARLVLEKSFERPAPALGVFGSHCDEFVARRRS